MDVDTPPQTGEFRNYLRKLALFSPNAWIVLAYGALTGLAFGVFRLLFNFYVLSLGGYDEMFLGMLTSVSSAAAMAMAGCCAPGSPVRHATGSGSCQRVR